MISRILSGLGDTLAPLIKLVVKEAMVRLVWPAFQKERPVEFKTALVSLYPTIDVHVETLAEGTPTEIDDAIVGAIKESMEEIAATEGIELPNLDDD